jgi:hypothetical protein
MGGPGEQRERPAGDDSAEGTGAATMGALLPSKHLHCEGPILRGVFQGQTNVGSVPLAPRPAQLHQLRSVPPSPRSVDGESELAFPAKETIAVIARKPSLHQLVQQLVHSPHCCITGDR